MTPMDPNAETANRFNELPERTQIFLSQLRDGDIELMEEGINLVRSLRTVGRFMRWVVLGFLALMVTMTALHDNAVKILAWWSPSK